jgi:phytoene desaturase
LSSRVIVIGAGLGGLSAAAHVRARGHDVLVVERTAGPGGRAGIVEEAGFRLDTGPTVLTMPELLADAFAAVGADAGELCPVRPVDPMYRANHVDGSVLHVWNARARMRDEIGRFAGSRDAAGFDRMCDWLADLYRVEMANFIDRNFDSVVDLLRPIGPAVELLRLGGFRRLAPKMARFFSDDRVRRVFSFQSMYAGLAPYEALSLYGVITYMDCVRGVYAPVGGMHRMASGLATALEGAGVSLRFGTEVVRVVRDASGRATGVELAGGERLAADAVVCNVDLPVAYRTLLAGTRSPRAARRGRYSPSCLLWIAGVKGTAPADAAHHNIHFGREWDGAFRAIIHEGRRMPDPSLLVSVPSVDDDGLAPPGCSSIYALEPAPNLDGRIDWRADRERIVDDLRDRVARLGYPTDAVVERVYDPTDWHAMGMERGTPFALAHTFRQTGPFRPGNVDLAIPGVVFVGSSTVPGVGVPMVLVSGKLAAQRVEEHLSTLPRTGT